MSTSLVDQFVTDGGLLLGLHNGARARMRERLLGRPTHVESLEMRTLFCADAAVEDYAFAGPVPFHRDSGEVHMAAMHGGGVKMPPLCLTPVGAVGWRTALGLACRQSLACRSRGMPFVPEYHACVRDGPQFAPKCGHARRLVRGLPVFGEW